MYVVTKCAGGRTWRGHNRSGGRPAHRLKAGRFQLHGINPNGQIGGDIIAAFIGDGNSLDTGTLVQNPNLDIRNHGAGAV